jgi:ribonuclease P protein component
VGAARAEDGPPEGEGFPRASRIRLGSEIRTLLREGVRARSSHLDVFTAPAPREAPRFGTVVPRHGRSAVARNQLRRRLKEIGRREVLPGLGRRECNVDVLVRSRPGAYEARFADLRAELLGLTERLCPDASFSA